MDLINLLTQLVLTVVITLILWTRGYDNAFLFLILSSIIILLINVITKNDRVLLRTTWREDDARILEIRSKLIGQMIFGLIMITAILIVRPEIMGATSFHTLPGIGPTEITFGRTFKI